jgi:hypothetical protein
MPARGSVRMSFALQVTMKLERPDGQLSTSMSIVVELIYEHGKWRGQCADPPVSTLRCDSLEEVLVTVAREIGQEMRVPA